MSMLFKEACLFHIRDFIMQIKSSANILMRIRRKNFQPFHIFRQETNINYYEIEKSLNVLLFDLV